MVPAGTHKDAVLAAVRALDHPTAEEVHTHLHRTERVGIATVYRNLARLVEEGALVAREIGDQKRYDPLTEPHVHIHDTEQDRLVDVPLTPKLREALEEIARTHLTEHHESIIELRGRFRTGPGPASLSDTSGKA
jgi:Fe2+ or Zn2+ uptake regulation protein